MLDIAKKASPTPEDIALMREHGWAWNAEERGWEVATWYWGVYWKMKEAIKTFSALTNPTPPPTRSPRAA
jgi:hypothetical protein